VNDGIRRREVQAGASRLQADQEHIRLAGLKLVALLLPILRRTRQQEVRDGPLVQTLRDQAQHARELGEDQHATPLGELLREQSEEKAKLGGLHHAARRRDPHEPGITADLP
jgi:hypothetical protein